MPAFSAFVRTPSSATYRDGARVPPVPGFNRKREGAGPATSKGRAVKCSRSLAAQAPHLRQKAFLLDLLQDSAEVHVERRSHRRGPLLEAQWPQGCEGICGTRGVGYRGKPLPKPVLRERVPANARSAERTKASRNIIPADTQISLLTSFYSGAGPGRHRTKKSFPLLGWFHLKRRRLESGRVARDLGVESWHSSEQSSHLLTKI